jgi:hypothetical protein
MERSFTIAILWLAHDQWVNLYTQPVLSSMSAWFKIYLRFYVPLKNISLILRRHHCRWRAAKFWPMLGAQSLWAGRDLYRASPAVTRDLSFSGLIRRIAPFSRLLRHTRGCGGSTLTRILTGRCLLDMCYTRCYNILRTFIMWSIIYGLWELISLHD